MLIIMIIIQIVCITILTITNNDYDIGIVIQALSPDSPHQHPLSEEIGSASQLYACTYVCVYIYIYIYIYIHIYTHTHTYVSRT